MSTKSRALAAGVSIVVATTLALGFRSLTADANGTSPHNNLKVALLLPSGKCGTFDDSLPALVTRAGVVANEVAGDVTVCAMFTGPSPGTISLQISQRTETDAGCTDNEASADTTCGLGQAGELGRSLVQRAGVGQCRSTPLDLTPALERRLPDLETSPLSFETGVTPKKKICVRLRIDYVPSDAAEALVSQSDDVTWRYDFLLTT